MHRLTCNGLSTEAEPCTDVNMQPLEALHPLPRPDGRNRFGNRRSFGGASHHPYLMWATCRISLNTSLACQGGQHKGLTQLPVGDIVMQLASSTTTDALSNIVTSGLVQAHTSSRGGGAERLNRAEPSASMHHRAQQRRPLITRV
jgi:hypothetical protein